MTIILESKEKQIEKDILKRLAKLRSTQNSILYTEKVVLEDLKNKDYNEATNKLKDIALNFEKDTFNEYRRWWSLDENKYIPSGNTIKKIDEIWKVSVDVLDDNVIKINLPPLNNKSSKAYSIYYKVTLFSLINRAVDEYNKSHIDSPLRLFLPRASILYLSYMNEKSVGYDMDNVEIKTLQDTLSHFFFKADDMLNLLTIFSGKKGDKERLEVYIADRCDFQKLLKYV